MTPNDTTKPAPLSPERLAQIREARYTVRPLAAADIAIDDLLAEIERLTARVAELEATR